MLANDARVLIRSAVATAIAGAIMIAISAIAAGGKGALGAALGVVLVAVFFSLSVVAVSLAGRWGGAAMTATALGTFLIKILAVAAVVIALNGTTAFSTKLLGVTAIVCILAWSAGQLATLARRRVLYVDPDAAAPARRPGPAGAARTAGTGGTATGDGTAGAGKTHLMPDGQQADAPRGAGEP